jgi:hypothetical protein
MRIKGSCRFEPYYKAQWYDEKTAAWRDVKKQFSSLIEVQSAFKAGKWRAMRVTMEGREVV